MQWPAQGFLGGDVRWAQELSFLVLDVMVEA